MNDMQILRELTKEYAQLAWDSKQAEIWKLHASVNDLHPIRPIVLIDEIPWHELNVDSSLTLFCSDPDFKEVEQHMRRTLFRHKYFPGDMLVKPYYPVEKKIDSNGIGVEVQEERKVTDNDNGVVSHKYEEQFACMEDLEKLHSPIITYDKKDSMRRFLKISEAIGDIIPVKLVGADTGYMVGCITWDIISQYMGIDTLLYNLIDEPEFMHALVGKLTDICIDMFRQYEELNLFNPDSTYVHSSAAASEDLRKEPIDFEHVKASNVWGRGLAQILSSVSSQMHDEFEVQYAKKALAPFGMIYYGCCEPLHNKIDVIKQIPNLRKISITPWADINVASEIVGKDYVISAKPNPANLLLTASNPEVIRKELRNLLGASRKNNCSLELLIKDISTVKYNLENLIVWNKIAMEEVKN